MVELRARGLQVPLKEVEQVRKMLQKNGLLLSDLKIRRDKDFVYLPISKQGDMQKYPVVETVFQKRVVRPTSYKKLVKLPSHLKSLLPTSFDVIGTILLIKIPQALSEYKREIGSALLATRPHVRTVCNSNPVSGELRTRSLEVIAGEHNTVTTHKEYGLQFRVDLQTTFFSPRLAQERKHVANQVSAGEVVVDMFAGVAPFSVMIASFAHPKRVYAIDKNKDAIKYARQNVTRNNVLDAVEVLHADAKDIGTVLPTKADRIIMNLPFSAQHFLIDALHIGKEQCRLHYYDIITEYDINKMIIWLQKKAKTCQYALEISQIRRIKTYAPREFYIGMDITATHCADVA